MSYNKDAYSRYKLIDTRLRSKQLPAPKLSGLVEYVSEKMGKSVSQSSIQKDIEAMRFDKNLAFNAPIVYDRPRRVYIYSDPNFSIDKLSLNEEDLMGLEMSIGILQQFKELPAIKQFEDAINKIASSVKTSRDSKNGSNILLMDKPNKYAGVQYMQEIVEAIRDKKVIKIYYQSFTRPKPKEHTVHPYFIKEYNGRLYLIGNDVAPGKASIFLTFAFDRITEVFYLTQSFTEEYVDKENYFKNTLGISNVNDKPEKIVLQCHPTQANYLKTQPLHHSQKIIIDNENEFTIELLLVINHELKSLVLSFGNNVKVLQPLILQNFIKQEAAKMLL